MTWSILRKPIMYTALALLAAGAVLALYLGYQDLIRVRKENARLLENLYQVQEKQSILSVKSDEIGELLQGKIDDLGARLNVAPDHIKEYYYIRGESRVDTLVRWDSIVPPAKAISTGYQDSCYRISVSISDTGTRWQIALDPTVEFALVREKKINPDWKAPKWRWFWKYLFKRKAGYRYVIKSSWTCPIVQDSEIQILKIEDR